MLRTAWQWLNAKRNAVQDWFASWLPGFKTRIVTVLGFLGSTAALLQEYITGLPIAELVTPTNLLIANMVLFTLAFWFRGLANREA